MSIPDYKNQQWLVALLNKELKLPTETAPEYISATDVSFHDIVARTKKVSLDSLSQPQREMLCHRLLELTHHHFSVTKGPVSGQDEADRETVRILVLRLIGSGQEEVAPTRAEARSDREGGIVNLGNTCYLNSTVQLLRASPRVREAFSTDGDLVDSLNDTMRRLDEPNNQGVNEGGARRLFDAVERSGWRERTYEHSYGPGFPLDWIQMDAAECLMHVSDRAGVAETLRMRHTRNNAEIGGRGVTAMLPSMKEVASLVGRLNQLITTHPQTFEQISRLIDGFGSEAETVESKTVDREFLKRYIRGLMGESETIRGPILVPEQIDFDLSFLVDSSFQDAQYELQNRPPFFFLNLGRFAGTQIGGPKDSTPVDFTEECVVKIVGGEEKRYRCKAVICHEGSSTLSGHYRTIAREEGEWVCYDDARRYVVDPKDLRWQSQAYVLLLEEVDSAE